MVVDFDVIKLGSILGNNINTVNQATQSWFESEQSPDQQLTGIDNIIIMLGTLRITNKYADGSTMVWNNSSQGVWDSNVWGGNAFSSETVSYVINAQNIFQDNICFNDFIDSTNTTASVSLTANTISFGSNQVFQSKSVAKDPTQTFSYYLFSCYFTGGTLTGQFSADGGVNWSSAVTLQNGITSNGYFPVYGNDIKFKLTGGAGTVITSPLYLKYG